MAPCLSAGLAGDHMVLGAAEKAVGIASLYSSPATCLRFQACCPEDQRCPQAVSYQLSACRRCSPPRDAPHQHIGPIVATSACCWRIALHRVGKLMPGRVWASWGNLETLVTLGFATPNLHPQLE